MLMMVGLPASGKTTWADKYLKQVPEARYNILGTNSIIDRMKVRYEFDTEMPCLDVIKLCLCSTEHEIYPAHKY